MALSDYKKAAFGSIRAPARAKEALLSDLQKAAQSPQELGLSKSQREGIADEATVKATQTAKEGAQDLAQAGLAGGGYTGQKAEGARQASKAGAGAGAAAGAGATQMGLQLARRSYDQTRARLEAQQERARQNAQFWSQQGVNIARGLKGALDPTKAK